MCFMAFISEFLCRQNKLTLDNMDAPEPNQDSSNTAATNTTVPPPQTDSGTPAILQMLKNQSKMSQSFYIASMQQKDDKTHGVGAIGGMTLGAPSSALTLGLGGGRGSSPAGGGERVSKPKWMVSEVSRFTMTGSELVRERNIISASMGINHVALLTGKYSIVRIRCCVLFVHDFSQPQVKCLPLETTGMASWVIAKPHPLLPVTTPTLPPTRRDCHKL